MGESILGLIKASNCIKCLEGEKGLTAGLNLPLDTHLACSWFIYIPLVDHTAAVPFPWPITPVTSTSTCAVEGFPNMQLQARASKLLISYATVRGLHY